MNKTLPHRVSTRLANITPSATLAVDAKAKALKAQGRPVIGYAAGEPDFLTPANIVQAAEVAVQEPSSYRYTPTPGLAPLRDAIAATMPPWGNEKVSASQVLVTNGGKQAVYQACAALINPGDEVILPAPYWTTYPESVKLAGGVPVPVVASYENDYKVTVDQLEAARTQRTVAIIHCSPSNPTGAVYDTQETRDIAEWALEHGIWVISDEIYRQLVYGDLTAPSVLDVVPEIANQLVVVNGVAKTYAMTGWRVGWMVGPKDVIKAATSLQSHLTSNVNNIAQKAAHEALTGPQTAVHEMRDAFDRRRHLIIDMLRDIPGFEVPMPYGAFYVFPRVTKLYGMKIGGEIIKSSLDLANILLDEVEVAVVPGEAFGTPGYLRFSYALSDDDLIEGLERVKQFLDQ